MRALVLALVLIGCESEDQQTFDASISTPGDADDAAVMMMLVGDAAVEEPGLTTAELFAQHCWGFVCCHYCDLERWCSGDKYPQVSADGQCVRCEPRAPLCADDIDAGLDAGADS